MKEPDGNDCKIYAGNIYGSLHFYLHYTKVSNSKKRANSESSMYDPSAYVLDPSAFIAYLKDKPAAQPAQKI